MSFIILRDDLYFFDLSYIMYSFDTEIFLKDIVKDTLKIMEYSKGHTEITIDFEGYFKGLTLKADKISSAIFLITNYVKHDGIKYRLQSLGIDVLEVSYMLHPLSYEEHGIHGKNLEYLLKEIRVIIHGLSITQILSENNKDIIHKEIDIYLNNVQEYIREYHIHKTKAHGIPSPVFDTNFFETGLTISQLKTVETEKKIEDKNILESKKDTTFLKGHEEDVSKGHPYVNKKDKKSSKTDMVDRMNRRMAILNFIKENKEVAIKDIQNNISDCSEKTIQRELNDLIKDGVLKKEGDRRWSKYSLLKDR